VRKHEMAEKPFLKRLCRGRKIFSKRFQFVEVATDPVRAQGAVHVLSVIITAALAILARYCSIPNTEAYQLRGDRHHRLGTPPSCTIDEGLKRDPEHKGCKIGTSESLPGKEKNKGQKLMIKGREVAADL
jgi:hypothetical protein